MALSTELAAALDRMKNFYEGDLPYDPENNPGGFRNRGHLYNFVNSLKDYGNLLEYFSDIADDLNTSPANLAAIKARSLVNNEVMCIGDSRIANGFQAQADGFPTSPTGQNVVFWANYYTGGKFRLRRENNFGITGNKTDAIRARIGDALAASSAAICLYFAVTNDPASRTYLATRADLDASFEEITSDGRLLVVVADTPRGLAAGTGSFTGSVLQKHLANVRALRELVAKYNGILLDPWPIMLDAASTYSSFRVGYVSDDEVHLANGGAHVVGRLFGDAVGPLLSPGRGSTYSYFDTFQGTNNPYGSLISNPTMDGGGGATGLNATGSVADDYTALVGDAGLAVFCEKVQETGTNRDYQKLTVSGTASSASLAFVELQIPVTVADLIVDEDYVSRAEVMIEAGYQNLTTNLRQWAPLVQTTDVPLPFSTRQRGQLISFPYTHAVTELAVMMRVRVYFKAGVPASAVIRVYSFDLCREV